MIASQLEVVQQATEFLSNISDQDYVEVMQPHFSGSAGAHMRHVIDHYLALKNGIKKGTVDYNKRNRFSDVESSPAIAISIWHDISQWLESIDPNWSEQSLEVISEVSASRELSVRATSSLQRELMFVSSHAIHHFSLLAIMGSLQGKSVPLNFGVAPVTAGYFRKGA